MIMISNILQQNRRYHVHNPRQRKALALVGIFGMHILILYMAFHSSYLFTISSPSSSSTKRNSSALFFQIFKAPTKTEQQKTKEEFAKKTAEIKVLPMQKTPQSNREKKADSLPTEVSPTQAQKAETNSPVDPALDPFAIKQQKNNTGAISNERDRYRVDAGKAWKQVESELPVKRWLSTKKELSTMEKFAQDLLEAAPAREIQTKEEMRPDGSRMTRVKTPRGEFCVVAPQPGRTYDVRGPEHRVMSCPIYF
jgi:hypothetical protein